MGTNRSCLTSMPHEVRELHIAVMRNDMLMVQQLVNSGIDMNYPWQSAEPPSVKDGSTPLCEAVSLNHRRIVEILLQAGASVNKPDSFGCTPLHKAAYHGRALLSELLISAGADIHIRDHNFNTPLHICVQNSPVHNSTETVKVLIRANAQVNEPNRFGKIALHYAAFWGLGDITEVLIKANSEIDNVDLKWKTPLHCCIRAINVLHRRREVFQQHLPAIKVLIMNGCDSLNLASWLRLHQIITASNPMDIDFYNWYIASQPECLKQLCREAIQKHLHYYDDNATKIRALPLPKILTDYLTRKVL